MPARGCHQGHEGPPRTRGRHTRPLLVVDTRGASEGASEEKIQGLSHLQAALQAIASRFAVEQSDTINSPIKSPDTHSVTLSYHVRFQSSPFSSVRCHQVESM